MVKFRSTELLFKHPNLLRKTMNDVITKARSLMNVLSDDVEDYPDLSAFRQMRDRSNDLVKAIQDFEKQGNLHEE